MQAGKTAVASAKEAVANIGASAKSGMDKTKAVIEEKAEKMTAHHPAEKEIAEKRKEEKLKEAETRKQEAMHYNAAVKEQVATGHNPTAASTVGMGNNLASTAPAASAGHNLTAASPVLHGDPVTDGVVRLRPIGLATGTERPSAAHNPLVGEQK
ncbi:putative 11 kDa late embryogenesis abundant protein [Iris pallida]|uniref:11 kDa late embryogenesis abundant protein n=1 Tax=Iris pallida TaxID=29817 RepID=A0AAX6GLB5_IRIPA|nr:putative 11 kDa late embryogenesis abundant protein [Iris pallida]